MKTTKKLLLCMISLMLLLAFPIAVMAAQKTVYVLSSVTDDGGQTSEFTYNQNGLLSKAVIPSASFGMPAQKLKASYTKEGLLKKVTRTDFNITHTEKFTYKGGMVFRHTSTTKYESGTNNTLMTTYKWNGKTFTSTVKDADTGEKQASIKGKLDSKNRLISLSVKYTDASAESVKYKYDAKGFLKAVAYDNYTTTFKNTVKNNRVTKKVMDKYSTYKLKYKKIKVPASFVTKVKTQQNYIVNNLTLDWFAFDYPMW